MGDKPQVMASLVTNINNNFLHGKQCKGKKAQRSPSLLGERIKQLLGVEEEPDSPPRSRKGLYQSVSSSNLTHHPASSSLPPQVPRSFYLGELGELPSQLRGSRSLHTSPHPTSLPQQPQVSPSSCSTPATDSASECECVGRPPYYVADIPLTSELADTNHDNQARNRNESHHINCISGPVPLRRHRSNQNLPDSCHHLLSHNRHSVHFDSVSHAVSGLETLDFPPRKKTWPQDGPRLQRREETHCKDCQDCAGSSSGSSCSCSLVNSVVYQKMMTIAGQHAGQCYIMCCCGGRGGAGRAPCRAGGRGDGESGAQSAGQSCHGHTSLQPQHEGQTGQTGQGGPAQPDMVLDTSNHWNGVSGVPGLGVSIPRSLSSSRPVSSLDEWDKHDRRHPARKECQVGSRSSGGMSSFNGVKVDIPRVPTVYSSAVSPRSSSCRSSGRSTGSRGSSALSQGLSNGSTASSSKYSARSDTRSDSVFSSRQDPPPRGHLHQHHHQKSSNPSRRGALGGTRCECVCTCGDPVPPKPVRRVMFSDDTSSPCSPCSCHKSLPPVPSASSSASCCCSPQCEAVQAGPEDAVPSNHYKSPHEVDGEYSYAYRVGASMNYSGSGEDETEDSKENIYEEIKDKSDENLDKSSAKDSRKSSCGSQQAGAETTKSKFQKALEAVTRRSSRSLDGSEKSFHLSISKGRKKSLIDKAKVDWDCYGPPAAGPASKLNKSSSDMFGEVTASHSKVMSQLKLDVENMLMPPPSPPADDTQDDSGFHSGGHSSNNSYSPKTKRKSIIKQPKSFAKRSESQPGRMNRCESIDFKEAFHDPRHSEVLRTRSKIISDHALTYGQGLYVPGPPGSIYSVAPPVLVQHSSGKKGTVNRSYLSKLVNFPFMGSSKSQSPASIYGKNNNLPPAHHYEDESGRSFYL